MKLAQIAVLGVAVGAGLLTAILAVNLTGEPQAPPPTPQPSLDVVDVLVATTEISTGTTLQSDMVAWEAWPTSSVTGNFFTRETDSETSEEVTGALARTTFYAGEPINEARLIRAGSGYMSAILPQGMRAVATRIEVETSAGGFVLPNDHVDVIMTRQDRDSADGAPGGYVTETILNNVRVLAIDQTIEEQNGEKVVIGQTATLELSLQQAEILTVAQQLGDRLALALRSMSDIETRPGEETRDAVHLVGGGKRNGAVTLVKGGVAREVSGLR